MTAFADASLIDGPARTVVLVLGGLACAAFALAWLLCRAAAIADRVEPGRDDPPWGLLAYCERCSGHPVYAREPGRWVCIRCREPQRAHADLAAFERGER